VIRRRALIEQQRKLSGAFDLVSQAAWWIVLASFFLSGVIACELGPMGVSPTPDCRESGMQCKLPEGPLGVCERSICDSGGAPPCFQCTPQH